MTIKQIVILQQDMKKSVKVNYPKKKTRLKLSDLGDVSEPERCSMYQELQSNLKLANRTTFLHRIIYVGAHKFSSYDEAKNVFQAIITKCNETYCLERLSGFLLYYYQYIVHMVEGDEDNLNKHLGYLLDKAAEHSPYLGTIKLVIHVSNINQRFFEDWISCTGSPSKLLEKLDVNADLQLSGRTIYNCIKKVYGLAGSYAESLANAAEAVADAPYKPYEVLASDGSFDYAKMYGSFNLGAVSSSIDFLDRSMDTVHAAQKEYKYFLPEYELLEFVIQTTFTMNLQDYYDLYGVVPMRDIYKDRVWPVPHDFIPYDVFERPYNCVTELAKAVKKRLTDQGLTRSASASVISFADAQRARDTVDAQTEESNAEIIDETTADLKTDS